jgi:hypothetical protein
MATYKRIKGDYTISTLDPGDKIILDSDVEVTGNITGNLTVGNLTADVITATYYIGDGQYLSNVTANIGAATILQNGTSNVSIPQVNGNVRVGVNGLANIVVFSTTGANITVGTVSTSNITGALIVNGGAGIAGNVYANAMYANNLAVLDVESVIDGGTY